MTRPFHKKESGLMISGGICGQGLGNLAFHTYNVNKFSYKQIIKFYHNDSKRNTRII